MSIRWMTLTWDRAMDVKGTALLVLLCIADHAQDETGEAWPSVARLAQRTRMSERAVQKALAGLEAKGYIVREMRPGHSTRYTLLPQTHPQLNTPANPAPPQFVHQGGEPAFTTGVNQRSPITVREPSSEPSSNPAAQTGTPPSESDTVSEPPDWVKKIEWMSPEKFQMAESLGRNVDVVATLGHYRAWSEEHDVDQSYSRFWQWLAKAQAAAVSEKNDEDINVRTMRAFRQQQMGRGA